MAIIRQSIPLLAVPDFRNLGTCLKILLLPFFFLILVCLIQSEMDKTFFYQCVNLAAWVCPSIVVSVCILYTLGSLLIRATYRIFYVLAIVISVFSGLEFIIYPAHENIIEHFFSVLLFTLFTMHYFALLKKALSPAETEARLAALTARIRPHFLFNSLNAAISLVRSRPIDAEMVLENLASLFRAQLADHTKPSTLETEIELAKDYLAIEQIRMGANRLEARWNINAPTDTTTPTLLLQPLLENAVYHGIEPLRALGIISVEISSVRNWIYITISNPLPSASENNLTRRKGNHMALKNLSERLALMFDQDASLSFEIKEHQYLTKIRIPYRSV